MKVIRSRSAVNRFPGRRVPLRPGLMGVLAILVLVTILCIATPAARADVEINTEQGLINVLDPLNPAPGLIIRITDSFTVSQAIGPIRNGYTVTIDSGKTLTMQVDWTVDAGGTLAVNGAFTHGGDLSIGGAVRVNGTMVQSSGASALVVEPGGYLVVESGSLSLNGSTVVSDGSTFGNYNQVYCTGSFLVENGGIFAQSADMRFSGSAVGTVISSAPSGGANFILQDDSTVIFGGGNYDISGIQLSGNAVFNGQNNASFSVNSCSISDGAMLDTGSLTVAYGSLSCSGNGGIMLSGGLTVNGANCTFVDGSGIIADHLTNNGSITLSDSAFVTTTGQITNGGYFGLHNDAAVNCGSVENGDSIALHDQSMMSCEGLSNSDSVFIGGGAGLTIAGTGLTNRRSIRNEGMLILRAAGTNEYGGELSNVGMLTLDAGFTNDGIVNNYATIQNNGSVTNNAFLYTAMPQAGMGSTVEIQLAGGGFADYTGTFYVHQTTRGTYPLPVGTSITPSPAGSFTAWQDVPSGVAIGDPTNYAGPGPALAVYGSTGQLSFLTLDLFADAYEGYVPVTADLVMTNQSLGTARVGDTRYSGDTHVFNLTPLRYGLLDAGDSISVPVSPVAGLSANTYQVTVEVEYRDDIGNPQILTGVFTFTVLPSGQLDVNLPNFPDAYEGYDQPAAQELVAFNPGPGDLELLTVQYTGDTGAVVPVTELQPGVIAAGASQTGQVRPAAGLVVGTYTLHVAITYRDAGNQVQRYDADIPFTVVAQGSSLLEITVPTFPDLQEGYEQPAAQDFVLTNRGPGDATVTNMTAVGADDFNMNLVAPGVISAGDSRRGSVAPKAGLSAGRYQATLQVDYLDAGGQARTETAVVSFTVLERDGEITSLTASIETLNAAGGDVPFTLTGRNIAGRTVTIQVFGPGGTPVGGPVRHTPDSDAYAFTLTFQPNETNGDVLYTVRASLDGGTTWGAAATVTVLAAAVTGEYWAEPEPQPKKDFQMGVVVNVSESVNVRSGPGTDYALVGEALLNSRLSLLEWNADETWCKVRFDDDSAIGWVYYKYIKLVE